ncbi:Prolipoprotein diacylglyceryl transferase [Anoxybacillus sp. BCO1]|nr:Prolipoprotein diacylglyceryl transferase [Anoxybacillus sp. BCO1]
MLTETIRMAQFISLLLIAFAVGMIVLRRMRGLANERYND